MTVATARNRGFVTDAQQERLGRMLVAIGGAGGDGGRLAVSLVRLGVRRFRLADPEVFDEESLNRQTACTVHTIGQNKAEAVGALVRAIAPDAEVDVWPTGVDADNVQDFVAGADLIADETEFTLPELGVLLNRAARSAGVPVVLGLNVGFGALVTSFVPGGCTFEEYLGLDVHRPVHEIRGEDVELWRWAPVIPSYTDPATLDAVAAGIMSAPSVAPGVDLCGGMLASEVMAHLVGIRPPVLAPECLWFDVVELRMERIVDRRARFHESLQRLAS